MQQMCKRHYSNPEPVSTRGSEQAGFQPSALNTHADSSDQGKAGAESLLADDCQEARKQHESQLPGPAKCAIHSLRTSLLLLKLASLCQLDGSKGIPVQPQKLYWDLACSMQFQTMSALQKLSVLLYQAGPTEQLAKVQEDVETSFVLAAPVLVQSLRHAVLGLHGNAPTPAHPMAALTCLTVMEIVIHSGMTGIWGAFGQELFRLGGSLGCLLPSACVLPSLHAPLIAC